MTYDFLFRFDANLHVGVGHLQRAISLIQPLEKMGFRIACLGDFSLQYLQILKDKNLEYFDANVSLSTKCLIVDHYDELDYLIRAQKFQKLVLFVDQNCTSHQRPDIVISAFGDSDELKKCFPNASVFTGIEYLSFRQDVYDLSVKKKYHDLIPPTSGDRICSVVVSLGGSDQIELLERICKLLLPLKDHVDVCVMSPVDLDVPNEFRLVVGFDSNFLHKASGADLVICGVGQTYLELSKIGVNCIGIVLADNQLSCADVLAELGGRIIRELKALDSTLPGDVKSIIQSRKTTSQSYLQNVMSSKLNLLIEELMKLQS